MMKHLLIRICCWLLASISGPALSADVTGMSLEELLEVEIVSAATKMALKPSETPSAVRVITSDDIRRYGWRTLGEALNSLPGITVITNRYYDFVGARGVVLPDDYNTRYLMLIDGTPVNDALLESAFIGDAFPLDMALIERIEYVPGAGSVAYGANAMLGSIHITTKSAKNKKLVQAEAGLDSVGRRNLRVTSMQSFDNGAALSLSATGMWQRGQDQDYPGAAGVKTASNGLPSPDGVAHDLDRTINRQLFAKLEKEGVKLSLMLSERDNHPSTAPHNANFDDPDMQVNDRTFDLTAQYSGQLTARTAFYGNLTYMGYRNETTFPRFNFAPPRGKYLEYEESEARRWFGEFRLTSTYLLDHQTALGMDFSKETMNEVLSYDQGQRATPYYQSSEPDTRVGLYLQDQWKFAADWQLHTGMRLDHSKTWGSHFSPRLGLVWHATPSLTLKGIAAKAFRNPNPLEARGGINSATPAPFEMLSNRGLDAESVETAELVMEWRPKRGMEFSGTLYHHRLQDLIGITTAGRDFQYQNLFSIHVTGLETAAHMHLGQQWKLTGSLDLQHAETGDGAHAPNAPHWMLKTALDGPLASSGLLAAWELHAVGPSRQEWEGKIAHNSTSLISNLVLTANNWLPKTSIQMRINNLFDRDDAVPGSDDTPVARMPLYERNASISVRYEF